MIVATWNVNGIRKRAKEVIEWTERARPDVVCLQEIKATPDQIEEALFLFPEYASYWHGQKGGYSGVSLHVRKGLGPVDFSHPSFDAESRIVLGKVGGLVFGSVYVPNGGKDYPAKVAFLKALARYVSESRARGERLVLCGDMNVTREARDVHPSQRDERVIGQRPEERELFATVLAEGLVDATRVLFPDDERLFTWWPYWRSARARNLGWRLDYVLASAELSAASCIIERETGSSDHAPLIVSLAEPSHPQKPEM